ncbi:MAG TPA: hypothetical protein VE397_00105 [Stellaceae bacterium]|jgi:hypothetical protein|nr:hypothetical protein [Stellaceae bacterium]
MAEPTGDPDQVALWRRWREAAVSAGAEAEPDALTLAAYAEGRLAPQASDAVEDWLAFHPQAVADILAARQASDAAPAAPAAVIARAMALCAAGTAEIRSFPGPATRPGWRHAVAWGAMAASILVASLVGFEMGNSTYATLTGGSATSLSQELLDPPTGLFNADEDSNT